MDISEDETTWLLECWNHLIINNNIANYRQIRVKIHKRISKDFKPSNIDHQLIQQNVEITIQGLIALNLAEKIFDIGNKTFQYIKNKLFEDADQEQFDLNFIADCIEEDRNMVRISFKLFSNESLSLWSSAGSRDDKYGFDSISISDRSFETYLGYDSMEDVFIANRKRILEYQNNKKDRVAFKTLTPKFEVNNISNNLFPLEILDNTRGYVFNIGSQASECYNSGLYDACLVMIRKLVETLIIECFERHAIEEKIKGKDKHYFFLSDLIIRFLKQDKWPISRNTSSSLPKIKKLGDLSAHNARFSAKKLDIEKIKDDLRVVIEDLIHLIDYPNWTKN